MKNARYVYGIHAVQQYLQSHPKLAKTFFYIEKKNITERIETLIQQAKQQKIACQKLSHEQFTQQFPELDQLIHQGVVLLVNIQQTMNQPSIQLLIENNEAPIFLLLDCITDPHNLGACLRTAEAAGVTAVIIPKDKSVGITETVRKVACGAAELVPVIAVTNLVREIEDLKAKGVWVVGLDINTEQMLYSIDLTGPIALIMGSEGKGMRELTRKHCDYIAKIPMVGSMNSLNVSVATGVALFEVVRQRVGCS